MWKKFLSRKFLFTLHMIVIGDIAFFLKLMPWWGWAIVAAIPALGYSIVLLFIEKIRGVNVKPSNDS